MSYSADVYGTFNFPKAPRNKKTPRTPTNTPYASQPTVFTFSARDIISYNGYGHYKSLSKKDVIKKKDSCCVIC